MAPSTSMSSVLPSTALAIWKLVPPFEASSIRPSMTVLMLSSRKLWDRLHTRFANAAKTYLRSRDYPPQFLILSPSDLRIIKMIPGWILSQAPSKDSSPKLTMKVAKKVRIDFVMVTGITLFLVLFL